MKLLYFVNRDNARQQNVDFQIYDIKCYSRIHRSLHKTNNCPHFFAILIFTDILIKIQFCMQYDGLYTDFLVEVRGL